MEDKKVSGFSNHIFSNATDQKGLTSLQKRSLHDAAGINHQYIAFQLKVMEALHPHFEKAVSCLDQGDLEGLKQLISDFPELVHVSHPDTEEPYSGYFYGATLLHHVAFNPHRDQQMPGNIVDLTCVLLEAGADPNAICGGGPTQPNPEHGKTADFVRSSTGIWP